MSVSVTNEAYYDCISAYTVLEYNALNSKLMTYYITYRCIQNIPGEAALAGTGSESSNSYSSG